MFMMIVMKIYIYQCNNFDFFFLWWLSEIGWGRDVTSDRKRLIYFLLNPTDPHCHCCICHKSNYCFSALFPIPMIDSLVLLKFCNQWQDSWSALLPSLSLFTINRQGWTGGMATHQTRWLPLLSLLHTMSNCGHWSMQWILDIGSWPKMRYKLTSFSSDD